MVIKEQKIAAKLESNSSERDYMKTRGWCLRTHRLLVFYHPLKLPLMSSEYVYVKEPTRLSEVA